jgi:hypothetical protein
MRMYSSSQNEQERFNKIMNASSSGLSSNNKRTRSRREIEKGNNIALYVGLVIFIAMVAIIIYGIRFLA